MPPHIVVVGSINMDLVVRVPRLPRPGETLHAHDFQTIPGGKGANQAVAAARLGARVTMIGRIGDDSFGSSLKTGLANEGIDVEHVRTIAGCSSGLALIAVDQAGENSITVVAGANAALTPDDVRRHSDVIAEADMLLVQLEVPLETVTCAVELARSHGVRTILDPAPMPDVPMPGGLFEVDVFTPNQSEAACLTGIAPTDTGQQTLFIEGLRLRGARNIVLKQGARGAWLSTPEEETAVASFEVPVVDTTAAGDAFTAALAVGIGEKLSLADAVRFACAAGALATTRLGAQPAMPRRREVDELLAWKGG